jgi:putative transposase
MADYRRYYVPGGTFFFTLVTYRRQRLFADATARGLLGDVMRDSRAGCPASIVAIVLLPDHLHTIWTMDSGYSDYSRRWAWIKKEFTKRWLASGGDETPVTAGARQERRHGIWQRRFWEHTIRDEEDLDAHFDYIHYNPVKHGLVQSPRDWPWSSFHRYVRLGHYTPNWGTSVENRPLPGDAGE